MTTSRAVRDQVKNICDYLIEAELALYANEVSMSPSRVSWQAYNPEAIFLSGRDHANLDQYLSWVAAGAYSAILRDGSLLQITYDFSDGAVAGHRLAYIPCPFSLDSELLNQGEPIADVVEIYREQADVNFILRSPVRFDFDPSNAKIDHPAAHMTINSSDCRIACVAPMHAYRFVDFVFRHFYANFWRAHKPFFTAGTKLHVGDQVIAEEDQRNPHLMWNMHAEIG